MAAIDLRLLPAGEIRKSIHPALVPVASSSIERLTSPAPEGEEARDTGPDGSVADDDRKRVLAALLVLGALVIWILFLND